MPAKRRRCALVLGPQVPPGKRFIDMDKEHKEQVNLDEQGDESTASGAPRPSGNASQTSVTKPANSEKSAEPGQLPDPNTEMVGNPSSPGRRPESTPETQRDSQAKV